MMANVQQTGRAAAASGVLMILGIQGEWVLDPQRDDGTVRNMPVFALLLLTATVGFALLFLAVRGLAARAADPTRPARIGSLLTLLGAGLLVAFGVTALVTSLLAGSPLEASFLAFLLGMLLLSIGAVTWGLSQRRVPRAEGAWHLLVLAGVAAFAALAIEPDPWHDVSLVLMCAAWSGLGVLILRRTSHREPAPYADTSPGLRATGT